jgi:hypothetical protein
VRCGVRFAVDPEAVDGLLGGEALVVDPKITECLLRAEIVGVRIEFLMLPPVYRENDGVGMTRNPLLPGRLFAQRQLSQLVSRELATDCGRGHDGPPAVGLPIAHDQGRLHQCPRGLEVENLVVDPAVVDHGRVGQRSPNGGEHLVADAIVDDLVTVEEVEAVGSGVIVHDDSQDPGIVGDLGLGRADEPGIENGGYRPPRQNLLDSGRGLVAGGRWPDAGGGNPERREE